MREVRNADGFPPFYRTGIRLFSGEEALKKALELIPEGSSVGWGGAESCEEIGLMKALHAGNYRPMDRSLAKTPEEREQMMRDMLFADVFLSGAKSLLTIENPNATTDRELVVFRDSFGSSMVPLLVRDYAKVTLVDIRYLSSQLLGRFMEFNGQDVLFLYSTLVLNNSTTIK